MDDDGAVLGLDGLTNRTFILTPRTVHVRLPNTCLSE